MDDCNELGSWYKSNAEERRCSLNLSVLEIPSGESKCVAGDRLDNSTSIFRAKLWSYQIPLSSGLHKQACSAVHFHHKLKHMRSSSGASRKRGRRAVHPSAQLGSPPSNAGCGGRGSNISNDHCDRRMEHIASVSRSSGLEKDGDS